MTGRFTPAHIPSSSIAPLQRVNPDSIIEWK